MVDTDGFISDDGSARVTLIGQTIFGALALAILEGVLGVGSVVLGGIADGLSAVESWIDTVILDTMLILPDALDKAVGEYVDYLPMFGPVAVIVSGLVAGIMIAVMLDRIARWSM